MKLEHFKGKDVYQHLKDAREKGARATSEIHGIESPGHLAAGTDSAKETGIILLALYLLLSTFSLPSPLIVLSSFSIMWTLWKAGRSALLGWSRLERLHRLIEEERWEIEHHRSQEKTELRAMYQQKGFSEPLLDQVVNVLMADDNRLLRVMLEEELGLSLESFEHPLKQAAGALIGTLVGAIGAIFAAFIGELFGISIFSFLLFTGATLIGSKREGNALLKSLIWNLAVASVAIGSLYLILRMK